MTLNTYLLINTAIFLPLWIVEAWYSMEHPYPYDPQVACAAIVFLCIPPATAYFAQALKAQVSSIVFARIAIIALLTPFGINAIGSLVANNFGGLQSGPGI